MVDCKLGFKGPAKPQNTHHQKGINPKQVGLLQIGMAGGGQILSPPLCNFCLNGPIDLKFGV